MMDNIRVAAWVEALAERDIPVLAGTVAALADLKARADAVSARDVAQVVLRDPLLALRVIRHLQARHSRRRLADITTVEHALMMLGIEPFFAAFSDLPVIERRLAGRPRALAGLAQVVGRARAAALYAGRWAALRHDIETDEIILGALLHDVAELLLWCFSPDDAVAVADHHGRKRGLRSATIQRKVFGFSLLDLQLALARRWVLPDILLALMDDHEARLRPRVQNVSLAVALARHSAHGWDDPALPDDYSAIARLLNRTGPEVRRLVFEIALEVIRERDGCGLTPSWLPPLPPQPMTDEPAEGVTDIEYAFIQARTALERGEQARALFVAGGSVQDARPVGVMRAVAAVLDGASRGLGLAVAGLFEPDPTGAVLAPRYVSGDSRWGGIMNWRPRLADHPWLAAALDGQEPSIRTVREAATREDPVPMLPADATVLAQRLVLAPRERALVVACGHGGDRNTPDRLKQALGELCAVFEARTEAAAA